MYLVGHGGLPPFFAARSDCMCIHAGTLGTFLREVGRSPSGLDQVFLPGKKKTITGSWDPSRIVDLGWGFNFMCLLSLLIHKDDSSGLDKVGDRSRQQAANEQSAIDAEVSPP